MSDWQTRLKPLNVTKIHIQDTGQARPEGVVKRGQEWIIGTVCFPQEIQ